MVSSRSPSMSTVSVYPFSHAMAPKCKNIYCPGAPWCFFHRRCTDFDEYVDTMETLVEFCVCTVNLATICSVVTKQEDFKIALEGFSPESTVLEMSSQETDTKLPTVKDGLLFSKKKQTNRSAYHCSLSSLSWERISHS